MPRRLLALALAFAAAGVFASTATANAACTASQPSSTTYADPVDADPGAPEITTVRVSIDAACHVVVDPGIAAPLADGDSVFVYLDTDGDATTGDRSLGGADVAVGTVAHGGAVSPPTRGTWNGRTFAFGNAAVGTATGNGGFSATVDALSIRSGVVIRVLVASMTAGDRFDVAPSDRPLGLPVTFATVAGDEVLTYSAASCAVPLTKGMTVRRATARIRARGCTVASTATRRYSATVRRGRVIGTSTAAGGSVRLVVSKGARPRG